MSDLADRADGCAAIAARGAVFVDRNRCTPAAARQPLPACSCGGHAVYRPGVPMRGVSTEVLACGTCGNSVGPYASRQVLAAAWRLGGWKIEDGGRKAEDGGRKA